jgi:DNA-binding protein HU-beta
VAGVLRIWAYFLKYFGFLSNFLPNPLAGGYPRGLVARFFGAAILMAQGKSFKLLTYSSSIRMNKQDIAEKVHGVLGGTKADAERAVEAMIDAIVSSLKKSDDVSIAGLGIFKTKMRAARTARNPRTGATVQVPAMRVPKFQPAKALKEAVR